MTQTVEGSGMSKGAWGRTGVVAAFASGFLASLVISPPSVAAPALPEIGESCRGKSFWKEYPVQTKQTKNGKFVLEPVSGKKLEKLKKAKRLDWLACVPIGFHPDQFENKVPNQLGEWTLVRYPDVRRLPDVAELIKLPQNDPCRLPRITYLAGPSGPNLPNTSIPIENASFGEKYPQGLGSWDRAAANRVPSTGTVKGVMIPTMPEDRLGSWPDRFWQPEVEKNRELAEYMQDYFAEQSQGWLDLQVDVYPEKVGIPEGLTGEDRYRDVRAAVRLIDDEYDFSDIDFIVQREYNFGGRGGGAAFLFDEPIEADGNRIYNLNMTDESSGVTETRRRYVAVHEQGHLFGLPDLYTENQWEPINPVFQRFAGDRSVMSSNLTAGFTGFERWVLGWLPDGQVSCVTRDGEVEHSRTVTVSSVDSGRSTRGKIVVFPIGLDTALVAEYRNNARSTTAFDTPGVFVYAINSTTPTSRFVGLEGEPTDPALTAMRRDDGTLALSVDSSREAEAAMIQLIKDESIVPEGGEASWRGLTITNPVLNGSNGQFTYTMTW